MKNSNIAQELVVCSKGKRIYFFYSFGETKKQYFHVSESTNGIHFKTLSDSASISDEKGKLEDVSKITSCRISKFQNKYLLTYRDNSNAGSVSVAISSDFIHWKKTGVIQGIRDAASLVPDYDFQGNSVVFFGEDTIRLAFSKDLSSWKSEKQPVLEPSSHFFDNAPLEIATTILTPQYILVIYYVKKKVKQNTSYCVGAALFYKEDPHILLWRSNDPLWEQPAEWDKKTVTPVGVVYQNDRLIFYWNVEKIGVFAISCAPPIEVVEKTGTIEKTLLKRHENNPILGPIQKNMWESKATFNPAAVNEGGKVHLVYRAIGDQDTSVLGYASSSDGVHIDERLPDPIYTPSEPFEFPASLDPSNPGSLFVSGGGYGGCEDPRLTKIGDRIYMMYVAHNGANLPRVAMTSISVDDFMNKNWNWSTPKLISPPGVVDKNACLLPEKIQGKYVVFHRIFPHILVDFVDDLEFNEYLKGQYKISPRPNGWDSLKIGVGAPPLKTDRGWLLIYQSVGFRDSGRYKIGAMLLDYKNPTKVLARCNRPILEPIQSYENEGFKSGVVYPCGAVIKDKELLVYYGGADMVVCVAKQNLDEFLDELAKDKTPTLEKVEFSAS